MTSIQDILEALRILLGVSPSHLHEDVARYKLEKEDKGKKRLEVGSSRSHFIFQLRGTRALGSEVPKATGACRI